MTAAVTTTAAARPASGELRRVRSAARVQSLQWPMQFWFPAGIFGAILLLFVAGSVVSGEDPGDGALYFGVPLAVLASCLLGLNHVSTVQQVFSFAIGIGITRRTFCLATALVAVAQGAALGALLGLLARVEVLTGGWGAGTQLFGLGRLSPLGSAVAHALMFLLCASAGVLIGAVYKRWGMPALWALVLGGSLGAGVVVGAGIAQGWWVAVLALLAGVPGAVLLVAGSLLLAGVLNLAGFAVLRRTVP
jgi:hypothetical protein